MTPIEKEIDKKLKWLDRKTVNSRNRIERDNWISYKKGYIDAILMIRRLA